MQSLLKQEFNQAQQVLTDFMNQPKIFIQLEQAITVLINCFKRGNSVLSCGNGGSMTDAMHFAEELTGKYRHDRHALPATAISDSSFISCVANDYGYAHIFERYVQAHAKQGDALVAFSTSGNSENIVLAMQQAQSQQVHTILLTGSSGGKAAQYADIVIPVPHKAYADRIQEIHIKIIHIMIHAIEQELFKK